MSQPAAEEPSGHSLERSRRHGAFGLALDVDALIGIPGLGPAEVCVGADPPTRIELNPQELERRWQPAHAGGQRLGALGASDRPYLTVDFAERAGYLLWAEGCGRVLISTDGRQLLCDPARERADWTTILWAQALPFAATLRGLEVLHAAGVVIGAGAVLLAGEPGAGKSSLAAALVRRGAGLLGDDALALEQRAEKLVVHPSTGLLHLRPAEEAPLSPTERSALGTPAELAGKRRYTRAVASAAPLAALLLLERSARDPVLERLEAVDPFDLLASTFNLSIRTPERLRRQLDVVAALAAGGRVYRLRVQAGMDATRLARLIDEQLRVGTS
jgi:hypothetical protein